MLNEKQYLAYKKNTGSKDIYRKLSGLIVKFYREKKP